MKKQTNGKMVAVNGKKSSLPTKSVQQKKAAKSNGTGATREKEWAKLNLDDFINGEASEDDEHDESDDEIDEEDSEEDYEDGDEEADDEEGEEEEGDSDSEDHADDGEDSENDMDGNVAAKKHKKALSKLQTTDPEFYQFLSENDKALLDFDTSDDEDEEAEKSPKETPEVGSDESDFEDEESAAKRPANVITQKTIDKWQEELQSPNCIRTIVDLVDAFRSAVHSVSEDKEGVTRFVVQGSTAFNAVVRLCIVDLIPGFKRFLKVPLDEKFNLEKCKTWVKLRSYAKTYLADVIRLLGSLTESSLLSVILKHIHQLIPFYSAFPKLSRVLCKRLITVWCSAENTVRVLAFLSILRLARTLPSQLLEPTIKAMYLSFARNCKFTSPSTWPVINFMRRSLIEMLALQEAVSYKHAFLYIRQLAIHLRNAITSKKKDAVVAVYNWQYVHCLHLWAGLLGALPDSTLMKPLLYPLVQIAIGTVNLVPTGRYYPLRFHICTILNQLATDTNAFIPILPFLLEIIQNHKFEKKPAKTSMKPLELSCVLRVSQSQMAESGYRDAIVELLYDRLLETLQSQSHSCSFPEIALPVILQLKQFMKKCPLANYTRKMKQLMEKIQETVQFVERQRATVHFELSDTRAAMALENQIKQTGTPLSTYYASWKKMRDRELAIKIAKTPEVEKEVSMKDDDEDEMDEIFSSDMSDDDEGAVKRKEEPKKKAGKKVLVEEPKKTVKAPKEADEDDTGDQVVDFDMSDEEASDNEEEMDSD